MPLKTKNFLFLIVLILLCLTKGAYAESMENKSIHWILLDFPPFVDIGHKNDDEIDFTKVTGALADIQRELVKNLDSYQHSFHVVSFQRAEKLFMSHKQYCTILFLKTPEREKYMIFGDRIASTFPPGIVMHKSKRNPPSSLHEELSVLDLGEILKDSFRLGIVKGRAFSPEIDKIIKQSKVPTQQLVANKAIGSLFKMLIANRLDGVISYYMEFINEQEQNPAAADLRFHLIKHNQNRLHLPVACERSPWGEKMVKLISQVAKKPTMQKKIALLLKQTVPPEPRSPANSDSKREPWPDKLQ